MPKRKRSEEESSPHKLTKLLSTSHQAIHHALKIAKGHERQRQSKRLRDPQTDAAKRARLQNEVIVLKSLDLNQIALTHLRAALLRIKSIAECEKLPEEVKAPVPKADLTEDEEKALHNVTSCLFARPEVKKETEKAIDLVGKALGVEVPEKKKGRVREKDLEKLLEKEKNKDGAGATAKETKEEAEQDETTTKLPVKEKVEKVAEDKKRKRETAASMNGGGEDSESESDVDEMADKEEQELAKLDALLGSSDDEPDLDEETIAAAKARNKASKDSTPVDELDPMEITSGEEDEADDYDMEDYELGSDGDSEDNDISGDEDDGDGVSEDEGGESGSESGSFQGFSDHEEEQNSESDVSESDSEAEESGSESSAILSPPRKKKATAALSNTKTDGSTFLPTLMGGYISDSNSSASDIDIAPNSRKNRRGQRARQAIWEKKYKEQAKHLHKVNNQRDAGWDLKRGAVDPTSAGKPWKMGIKNPLLEKDKQKDGDVEGQGENNNNHHGGRTLLNNPREMNARGGFGKGRGGKAGGDRPLNRKERRAMGIKTPVGPPGGGGFGGGGGGGGGGKPTAGMPPKKRDDEGPLHPSWEARKKAKAALETAPFQGKKITFD